MNAYIKIQNNYFRNPEFVKITAKPEWSIYMFLLSNIVRKSMYTGETNIFNNYYRKGMLCSRYSQQDIAKIYGWQQAYISKLIKKLVDIGLIKKIYKNTSESRMCIYHFGYYNTGHDDDGNIKKIERLFLDEIFGNFDLINNTDSADLSTAKNETDLVPD